MLVCHNMCTFNCSKIVNEKQVTSNHAYINGMDSANGVGATRSDTTPLAPFLPPLVCFLEQ